MVWIRPRLLELVSAAESLAKMSNRSYNSVRLVVRRRPLLLPRLRLLRLLLQLLWRLLLPRLRLLRLPQLRLLQLLRLLLQQRPSLTVARCH